jgi:hypothetical protein
MAKKILKGRARRAAILELTRKFEREGELELDDNAKISEGDDNGTYVQMWRWVEFCGTELCKANYDDHSEVDCPVLLNQENERDAAN